MPTTTSPLTTDDLATSMSLQETAALFHVSTDTVKRWIRAGRLGAIKTGRTYRVPQADAERRLNELRRAASD